MWSDPIILCFSLTQLREKLQEKPVTTYYENSPSKKETVLSKINVRYSHNIILPDTSYLYAHKNINNYYTHKLYAF